VKLERYRSVRAAVAAAQKLANRIRKPVVVLTPHGAPRTTSPTLRIPAESMRALVERRGNPLGLAGRPSYISPREWKLAELREAADRRWKLIEGPIWKRSQKLSGKAHAAYRKREQAYARRARAWSQRKRNPKGTAQLKELHRRLLDESFRITSGARLAGREMTEAEHRRVRRLDKLEAKARERYGFAMLGRGSLYPGRRRRRGR